MIPMSLLGLISVSIASSQLPPCDNCDVGPAWVDDIIIKGDPNTLSKTEITILGKFGNMCGQILSHKGYVDYINRVVNIYLWAEFPSRNCLTAITPFQYDLSIFFSFKGNWIITCNRVSISIIVS